MPHLRLKVQKKRPDRMSLMLDGEYWRPATFDTIVALEIVAGELSEEALEALSVALDARDAFDVAMRALSYRPRTSKELSDRLRQRHFSDESIASALERLEVLRLLDDLAVARNRAATLRDRGKGASSVAREMGQLGIEREEAADLIEEIFPADRRREQAEAALSRIARGQAPADRRSQQRLVNRLIRAGHSHQDAQAAVAAVSPVAELSDREGAPRPPAMEPDEIRRHLERRFPRAGSDSAEKRRALGWFMRRGVRSGEVLTAIAESD